MHLLGRCEIAINRTHMASFKASFGVRDVVLAADCVRYFTVRKDLHLFIRHLLVSTVLVHQRHIFAVVNGTSRLALNDGLLTGVRG